MVSVQKWIVSKLQSYSQVLYVCLQTPTVHFSGHGSGQHDYIIATKAGKVTKESGLEVYFEMVSI